MVFVDGSGDGCELGVRYRVWHTGDGKWVCCCYVRGVGEVP